LADDKLDFPFGSSVLKLVISHRNITAQKIRNLGLYAGQDIILLELLRRDHRSQSELVKTLQLDHSTVAKSARRLEKAEIVILSKSAEDKRVTLLNLTDKGKLLANQVAEIWGDIERIAFRNFDESEMIRFMRDIKLVTDNLSDND